jgi:hypothetical protein
MTELNFEYNDIKFYLQLEFTPTYFPVEKIRPLSKKLKKAINSERIGFYKVYIVSTKDETELRHYHPGLLLPHDEKEKMNDLDVFIDEEGGILDFIVSHWELEAKENHEGPSWAKK